MGQGFENAIQRFADGVVRWRWLVIIVTLMSVMAMASGMPKLGFSTDYRVFFSEDNPELMAFDAFQNMYTKNDNLMYVVQPKNGKVFSPDVAVAIEKLTKAAWQIPFALRVDSITNFQNSWADGDNLTVEDLIQDGQSISAEEFEKKQRIAMAEPLLRGSLIADDVETTGINVTLQLPQLELDEVPVAVAYARKIADDIRAEYPDLHIAMTGVTMMSNAFIEAGMHDMKTLMPLMYLVLIIVMFLTVRSFLGAMATLLVVVFAAISAMGMAGHMGVLLTPVSLGAPTIILTLAIADSIHILISMMSFMREGQDKISALKESVRINFLPVTITSVTTVVGFATLNFLDTPPFHDLGNMTGMGVVVAWIVSLTFLPAIISLLPIKVRMDKKKTMWEGWLSSYAAFVVRRQKQLLMASAFCAVVLIALIPRIELNDQWVEYFDKSIPFRVDAEFGMNELTGVYLIEYSIDSGSSGGINEPEYLRKLDTFSKWLHKQPEVEHVYSYSGIVKRLNKNMHGDIQKWYKIPESRELAAQYLLLYEISLPYGLDLNDRISIDKSATRLTVTLGNYTTHEVQEFLTRSEGWLEENAPRAMHAKGTGATVMFSYISFRNIKGMLKGNAFAIFMIALIMIVSLRSWKIGLLSLIPNSAPILMTFGLWAIVFGNIGMASATVSAMALGIVVDDSVHFLAKYLRARRERGLSRADAVQYAFRTVGVALVVTTIILTLGFLVMAMSAFQVNEQMGLMTATTIVLALVMDFTLLPTILLIGHKKDKLR